MALASFKTGVVGGIAFFHMVFEKAGDHNEGHAHSFNHPSWVVRGRAKIIANGKETEVQEDDIVWIPAGVAHTIVAQEDNTKIVCLQPLKSVDNPGDVIDEMIVPLGTPFHQLPQAVSGKFVPVVMADALGKGFKLEDLK